jgi:hypothetical protein
MKELSASEYVFLKWLADTHPQLYQAAEERQASLAGFMDSLSTVFTNISNAAPDLLNQYVKSQADLATLKMNLARAKAGDVPVTNAGQPYPVNAPGYNPSIFATIPLWVWLAFGAGAIYLLVRRN